MFAQKTGYYHANPVAHITRGIQLSHSVIHPRVTGYTFAPAGKVIGVVNPLNSVILTVEILVNHFGEMKQNLHKKLPPNQLVQK
jgi:hypothetical protein